MIPRINRRSARAGLFLALGSLLIASRPAADANVGTPPAEDFFDGAVDWINVARPIKGSDLKGKIILLDFWTYCCINCHHVLPDLEYLEKKYANQLVVIGVHTAKFDAERDTENIRKKVAEYKIKHPVVNDANQIIWNRFEVQSWPSLVVIDATGRVRGGVSGEGKREILDKFIGKLVDEHRAAKQLDESPLVFRPESEKPHDGGLLYPGKILADAAGKRLFISDTGHNRIVVTDLEGNFQEAIGDGEAGHVDGPFAKARFNRQQGLCLVGDILYVADTENHMIRAIDLKEKSVSTVAGTGQQFQPTPRRSVIGGPAKTTALSSPWDLVLLPKTDLLAIAMAGPHQICTLDLKRERLAHLAGDGRENIQDGSPGSAQFAQPSGLATNGETLFVADSEGSCVRGIGLGRGGRVATLVGQHDVPNVLFSFGDVDGKGADVRLQHCLGLTFAGEKLYIADSYNNRIKVCDPASRTVKTLAGAHQPGTSDEPSMFDEPGGLSAIGNTLFVADTNNHAIRAVSLTTGKTRTLKLAGVKPPGPARRVPKFPNATVIDVAKTKLTPSESVTLDVELTIPEGFKLNKDSPTVYLVDAPGHKEALGAGVSPTGEKIDPPVETFRVAVPLAKTPADGDSLKLKLSVSMFFCKVGSEGYCTFKNYVFNVPVAFADGGAGKVTLKPAAPSQ